jgi:hypothetical protein
MSNFSKIIIKSDPEQGTFAYSHLEPLVDFLISNGNSSSRDFGWGSNREGYFFYLSKPINFDLLEGSFVFPESIVLVRERGVIYCKNTGCVISCEP